MAPSIKGADSQSVSRESAGEERALKVDLSKADAARETAHKDSFFKESAQKKVQDESLFKASANKTLLESAWIKKTRSAIRE